MWLNEHATDPAGFFDRFSRELIHSCEKIGYAAVNIAMEQHLGYQPAYEEH